MINSMKWCPKRPATWVELNWKLFLASRMTLWEMSSVLNQEMEKQVSIFWFHVFLPNCTSLSKSLKSACFVCRIMCLKEHPRSETGPWPCTSNFRSGEYKQPSFRGDRGVLATVPHAAAPASGCLVGCGGQSSSTPRGLVGKFGLVGCLGGRVPLAT